MLPALTANKAVIVNSGGTALTVTTGSLALAGNLSTTGAYNTVLAQSASITLTLPGVSGTIATLAGTEELTNKTLNAAVGKGTWTASGTWTLPAVTLGGAITYGGVTLSNAVTGTGNMVLSASPTLTGTLTAAIANFSGLGTFSAGLSSTTVAATTSATLGNNNAGPQLFINGQNAANAGWDIRLQKNAVDKAYILAKSGWVGGGSTASDLAIAVGSGLGIELFTNGAATPTAVFDSTGLAVTGTGTFSGAVIMSTTATPTGTGAGVAGQFAWDTSYLYVCTATNDWRRIALVDF